MGSKSRIVKHILPIIQEQINKNNIKTYIEPFCGGCNVIDKIVCDNKIASDNNEYLIEIFKNLDKINTLPDFITKEHYSDVRNSFYNNDGQYPKWYIGAIGFLASYNGRFFDGGYAGLVKAKDGTVRNYYDEAKRNLLNQVSDLHNIQFNYCDYKFYSEFKNCLFYLDPPYYEVKQYGTSKNFNHIEFWDFVKKLSLHNIVLISEHYAPSEFKCIWSQNIQRTIDNTKRVKSKEKLFMIDRS